MEILPLSNLFQSYRSKRKLTGKNSQQRSTVVYAINPVTSTEFDFDFSGEYADISSL